MNTEASRAQENSPWLLFGLNSGRRSSAAAGSAEMFDQVTEQLQASLHHAQAQSPNVEERKGAFQLRRNISNPQKKDLIPG